MKRVPENEAGVRLSRRQAVAAGAAGIAALWTAPVLAGTSASAVSQPMVPYLMIPVATRARHANVELACRPASANAGKQAALDGIRACQATAAGSAGRWRATVLGLQARTGLARIDLFRLHDSGVQQIVWNAREERGMLVSGSPIGLEWASTWGESLQLQLDAGTAAQLAVPAHAGLYAAFPQYSVSELAALNPAVRVADASRPDAVELFARSGAAAGQRLGCLLFAVDRIA